MPPHRSSESAAAPKRGRPRAQSIDFAWLEERALRYVARWEASRAGVATLLERKVREHCERTGESSGPALEQIPAVVAKLVERGFVDDRRFAAGTLERLRRQGYSTVQISARLDAKGIAKSVQAELLAQEHPDTEHRAAWKLARRRKLGPYCKDSSERRHSRDRHLAAFSRQGFDDETALQIVDAHTLPEPI
jgi:regulatory protein